MSSMPAPLTPPQKAQIHGAAYRKAPTSYMPKANEDVILLWVAAEEGAKLSEQGLIPSECVSPYGIRIRVRSAGGADLPSAQTRAPNQVAPKDPKAIKLEGVIPSELDGNGNPQVVSIGRCIVRQCVSPSHNGDDDF